MQFRFVFKNISSVMTAALVFVSSANAVLVNNEMKPNLHARAPQETQRTILAQGPNGIASIVHGNIGNVGVSVSKANEMALQTAAAQVLGRLAADDSHIQAMGCSPPNFVSPPGLTHFAPDGSAHVRFVNMIQGMEVEGAAIVMHIKSNGTVYGFNGEIVVEDEFFSLVNGPQLSSAQALKLALEKAGLSDTPGQWEGTPSLALVRTNDGMACKAWKAAYFYETQDNYGSLVPHRDMIYADVLTGYLCALHPKIYGSGLAVETRDCENSNICGKIVSTSTIPISTSDEAIDAAHNYAIETYNFYLDNYGRDSIDGKGMKLISNVHYDQTYNNAFWSNGQMVYGDGDGILVGPLSLDADVVAHELTHGVTEYSSGLIYRNESGALNEAISDIFGSMVDYATGATGLDIWKAGEDIYTPGETGDALRYMYDPKLDNNSSDYYPDRYIGNKDNGGVHLNSGIANLAFYLICNGGQHPRGKTIVAVPQIRSNLHDSMYAAAQIFYNANVGCLTPSSDFGAARYCTTTVHGGEDSAKVDLAWDAVGVPQYSPPPVFPDPIEINDGEAQTGQNADFDNQQEYLLEVASVPAGKIVTCTTTCDNGDADLYLKFDARPIVGSFVLNDCVSANAGSNEDCTTSTADSDKTLHALVHAYESYTNLSIICTINNIASPTYMPTEAITSPTRMPSALSSKSGKGSKGGKGSKNKKIPNQNINQPNSNGSRPYNNTFSGKILELPSLMIDEPKEKPSWGGSSGKNDVGVNDGEDI